MTNKLVVFINEKEPEMKTLTEIGNRTLRILTLLFLVCCLMLVSVAYVNGPPVIDLEAMTFNMNPRLSRSIDMNEKLAAKLQLSESVVASLASDKQELTQLLLLTRKQSAEDIARLNQEKQAEINKSLFTHAVDSGKSSFVKVRDMTSEAAHSIVEYTRNVIHR